MLKSFLRFKPENYILEDQTECLAESEESCNEDIESPLPVKPGDVVKWIMNLSELTYSGFEISDLRIGITQCGVIVAGNIGTIVSGETQAYLTATIPSDLPEGCFEFIIYSIFGPADCAQFAGLTLQQTIDTNTTLGQVVQCTLNDFL